MSEAPTATTPLAYDRVKRVIDILLAIAGFLVAVPLLLLLAVLIGCRLGHPVLFRQVRPGRHGRPFTLVKFRTMLEVDLGHGLITDSDRLTPFGSFLRSTSLDELPTLWNVLRGDMSLVGPRPLLLHYMPYYTPEQARRFDVRPGITGLAQVSGRNLLPWADRFAADVDYVERRSLRLDLVIMARTFGPVLRRQGIAEAGQVTMTEFVPATVPATIAECATDSALAAPIAALVERA